MITIVDCGMGNSGSILNMMKKIGVSAHVSSSTVEIANAEKLILPGVGSFDAGMSHLQASGLLDLLHRKVQEEKTPVLGVCLGMQLLGRSSDEGVLPGLGWIDAQTVRFRFDHNTENLKIPHMGWNTATPRPDAKLFETFAEPPRFYFVHSYHVECHDAADIAATVTHGYEVCAAVQRGNIYGVQFHPEKSHRFGMEILRQFAVLPC